VSAAADGPAPGTDALDLAQVRARFGGLPDDEALLDNAATTRAPRAVLDALVRAHEAWGTNVHRAVHRRAREATEAFEGARRRLARFLGAEPDEVVFTRNATDAINLVARAFVRPRLAPGDEVVVTALEHHSNLVPWQRVCAETGAVLRALPVDGQGRLDAPLEPHAHGARTAFLAATCVSNAVGTIVPVDALVEEARDAEVPVLLDATQAIAHLPLGEGARAADFVALSGHKTYGPGGVGALRGRRARLLGMEPVTFGGEMVDDVQPRAARFTAPPLRFEAGTPNVAAVCALPAALEMIASLGAGAIRAHERSLLARLVDGLDALDGVEVVGPRALDARSGVVSFVARGADAQTVAAVLDAAGVAVRAGWHCAQPLLEDGGGGLGCGPTVRASVAVHTAPWEIDRLLETLPEALAAAG